MEYKSNLARRFYSGTTDCTSTVDFRKLARSMFMHNWVNHTDKWFIYNDNRCALHVDGPNEVDDYTCVTLEVEYPIHHGNMFDDEVKILDYFLDERPDKDKYLLEFQSERELDSVRGIHTYDRQCRYKLDRREFDIDGHTVKMDTFIFITYKNVEPDGTCGIDASMEIQYCFDSDDDFGAADCCGFYLDTIFKHYLGDEKCIKEEEAVEAKPSVVYYGERN